MNILVTGSAGQLGSELQDLAPNYPTNTYYFTTEETLDITDREAIGSYLESNTIDLIINCASFSDIDLAEDEAVECDRINHYGASLLASEAQKHDASLIIFSTNYVFDGTRTTPYTEDDATSAESKYAITKLASERVALAKCPNTMVIRTSWLYSSFSENNVLIKCYKDLKSKKSIAMCYDRVASPTYARDLAKFIFTVIDKGFTPGVFHYTNEGVCSLYDLAKMLQKFANLDGEIFPISSSEYQAKAYRPPYGILDKTKVKDTYKVTIPYWVDSLEECVSRIDK